jgi:hypothetical protein
MNVAKAMVGLGGVWLGLVAGLGGCGGGGAASTGSVAGAGGQASSSSTGTPPSTADGCCCPSKPSCQAADMDCLGLVDNSGKTRFGLRVADLRVTKPASLATGLVASVLASSIMLKNKDCFLDGSGTWSWLLQFDTALGTLTTGGAKPVADPTLGYAFVDEVMNGLHVQPVVSAVTLDPGTGAFSVAMGAELDLPVYLDAAATLAFVLPIADARLGMGTLSASQSCIGHFNSAGLEPANSCLPDTKHPTFVTGGSVDGILRLEDADAVLISATNQSLCALLAGPMYAEKDASGVSRCKRDATMAILFQGDACATAGQTCADAVAFAADYAASSVLIND